MIRYVGMLLWQWRQYQLEEEEEEETETEELSMITARTNGIVIVGMIQQQ